MVGPAYGDAAGTPSDTVQSAIKNLLGEQLESCGDGNGNESADERSPEKNGDHCHQW
jgi:hypothetical protein